MICWTATGLGLSLGGAALGIKLGLAGAHGQYAHDDLALLAATVAVIVGELGKVVFARVVLGRGHRWAARFGGVAGYLVCLAITASFIAGHIGAAGRDAATETHREQVAHDEAVEKVKVLGEQLRRERETAERPTREIAAIEAQRNSIANATACSRRGSDKLALCKQHEDLTRELDEARETWRARAAVQRLEAETAKVVVPPAPDGGRAPPSTKFKLLGLIDVDASWYLAGLVELLILAGAMAENTGVYHGGRRWKTVEDDGGAPSWMAEDGGMAVEDGGRGLPRIVDGGGSAPKRVTAEQWVLTQLKARGRLVPPQVVWAREAGVTEQTMGRAIQHLLRSGRVKWGRGAHGERELKAIGVVAEKVTTLRIA